MVSVLIAAAALVASSVLGVALYRVQRRLLVLEAGREQAKVRETQRARLKAHLIGAGRDCRLAVVNEGLSAARSIKMLVDGQSLAEHPLGLQGQTEVHELGPSAHVPYLLAWAQGKPTTVTVELRWTDDSDEPGSWRSQLKL